MGHDDAALPRCGSVDVVVAHAAADDDPAAFQPMNRAPSDRDEVVHHDRVGPLELREADGGLETVSVTLPCVITTDLRLNTPRYATLPGIMKAKKKPLDVVEFASLGVAADVGLKTTFVEPPKPRAKGIVVKDVAELVDALKKKGLVS